MLVICILLFLKVEVFLYEDGKVLLLLVVGILIVVGIVLVFLFEEFFKNRKIFFKRFNN